MRTLKFAFLKMIWGLMARFADIGFALFWRELFRLRA